MPPKICGIYFIKSADNTVGYVGQSVNISQRWRAHRYRYPVSEGWVYEILAECPRKYLNGMEIHYIALMKCYGYILDNKTAGGKSWAFPISPEKRENMSVAGKGKAKSAETRAKMSEAHQNRSPETRANMSEGVRRHLARAKNKCK